ncbi:MAG: hypothetical protein Q9168_000862 [Polycauliona sp. 1 TL-2023]
MYKCISQHWFPILIFAWTRLAASAPLDANGRALPSSQGVGPSILVPTRTDLSQIDIPEGFTIQLRYGLPGPPPECYFYNTIIALEGVALGDYDGFMPLQHTSTHRFPTPVIQFYGMGMGVPRKYLVWGFVMSIWKMLYTSTFKYCLVILYYHGVEVGGILYGPQEDIPSSLLHRPAKEENTQTTTPNLLSAASDPSITTTTSNSSQSDLKNITSIRVAANRVTVAINPFGDPIPPNNIYMTIISALSEAAIHPSTDRLQEPFSSQFSNMPCHFVTRPIMPARRTSPIYEWGHLIQALPQVMEYMIARPSFRESSMSIKFDGVTVGLASFFIYIEDEGVRGLKEG